MFYHVHTGSVLVQGTYEAKFFLPSKQALDAEGVKVKRVWWTGSGSSDGSDLKVKLFAGNSTELASSNTFSSSQERTAFPSFAASAVPIDPNGNPLLLKIVASCASTAGDARLGAIFFEFEKL